MLETVDLSKTYDGSMALRGLNLRVEPGEIFCLLGANGAGKTTTINLFLNFISPTSGTARVNGINVAEQPLGSKKHLAYPPEQVMLYKNLSGLENLEYFTALGTSERYSKPQLLGFLAEAGLPAEAAERRVAGYSRGMRQKVGIAIAIAKGPRRYCSMNPLRTRPQSLQRVLRLVIVLLTFSATEKCG